MKIKVSVLVGAAALLVAAVGTFTPAQAAPPATWAPADSAPIHPGTQTFTNGGQCTANYVFTDDTHVYIGQAAHCSGTGGQTETNGCDAGTTPSGTTQVEIDGATQPGVMVYNSWETMQAVGETDPDACAYNDFSLIRIHPDDHDLVNPSIPVWGGPVGIAGPTSFGDQVYSFGNSSLRQGIEQLSPKIGLSLGTSGGGWTHPLYTITPGIPGDSGSAFLDDQGRALGVLSTLALAPFPASNNVSDIGLALQYLEDHTSFDIELENGTEPFTGPTGILGILGG